MRLRRLDLTRYGTFTDRVLTFGESVPGTPDLHLIYGPNETGKSTLLAAWLDLLYGIASRSPFNFLHSYPAMRLGGSVELGGQSRRFIRVKRPRNSLLDEREQPVAEAAIQADLGGIDRDAYRMMFSLDDESLEQGGEAILKARGDLGQLLFSASSGLADLSGRLAGVRDSADGFYRPHARNGQLAQLQAQLDSLRAEREAIDTQAARYAELVEAARSARDRHDTLAARRELVRARQDQIGGLLQARPLLARWYQLREEIAPLRAIPEPPAGWAEELGALRDAEIRLETESRTQAETIATLTATLQALPQDETALALGGRFEDLALLRARSRTAAQDLPDRRQTLAELDLGIAVHLRQIEREQETDLTALLLPAARVERLRDLIESRSGIDISWVRAGEELAEAQARLAGMRSEEPAEPEEEVHLAALEKALAAWRESDHAARTRLAGREREEAATALADALAGLTPWQGEADGLVGMAVPDGETLQHWKRTRQNLSERRERQAEESERLHGEERRLTARREALERELGLAAEGEAAAARVERDQAWTVHRARLDADSADLFARAMEQDDASVARQLARSVELAQARELALSLALVTADLARAEALYAATQAESAAQDQALAGMILLLSPQLPSDWPVSRLDSWLAGRERALAARNRRMAAVRAAREAQEDEDRLAGRLATALEALGRTVPADRAALVVTAEAALEAVAATRRRRQIWQDRRAEVEQRSRAWERAGGAKQLWEVSWAEACAGSWLGDSGAPLSLATVRGILPVLAAVESALKERTALAERIVKMEQDQADFAAGLAALAEPLGLAAVPAAELDRAIGARMRQAEDDRLRWDREAERLAKAESAAQTLAEQRRAHDLRKQEMTDFFGVSTLAEVGIRLDQSARRADLLQQTAELTREIRATLGVKDLEAAEALLTAADPVTLSRERDDLAAEAKPLDQEWRDAYAVWREAEAQMIAVGGDDRVALLEERRRTILLEIQEGAQLYLRLRAGVAATERALRLYRERHRSAMMARAAQALKLISRGAYTDLTTQPDKDGEVLVAIGADGRSKLVTELSKGTRFQLYLALRVAGYLEFAQSRPPVPFIADDIMETFDDLRAEETLRLLAQMAETGQVIYLTHHRHLCEIARAVCPTVHLHELTLGLPPEPGRGDAPDPL